MAEIEEFLKKRAEEGLLRTLQPISSRRDGRICVGGREYVDFSSNDYLGLANHPLLIEANTKATIRFGTSSSASRLMTGNLELHHQLEEKLAHFKNKEAALVFNSGYQANLGIISALYEKGDCIFCDRLSHASILDGVLLSGARFFRFQHNDVGHLDALLRRERKKFKKCLILTETIFSMDGDEAPLGELVRLKEAHGASLMVDEAHATGIFGERGGGIAEKCGLEEKIELIMGTFSKGLGGFGAYVAASREAIAYLVNASRSFIYSTALPPGIIASNLAALDIVQEESWRRKKLLEMAQYFRTHLDRDGFEVKGSSQIVPLVTGENFKTLRMAKSLQENGFWVLAIRPPTVPEGEARLRFSLTVYHDKEILTKLIDELSKIKI